MTDDESDLPMGAVDSSERSKPEKGDREGEESSSEDGCSEKRQYHFICGGCGRCEASSKTTSLQPTPTFMHKCTRCKSIYYCNKACQIRDWTQGQPWTHKQCCRDFLNDQIEFQESIDHLIFPWAQPPVVLEELFKNKNMDEESLWSSIDMRKYASNSKQGCHGQALLHSSPKPSSGMKEDGWAHYCGLTAEEMPSGDPVLWPETVDSWTDYAHRRNLAPNSMAPLLLSSVLTIYEMLHQEFKIHTLTPRNDEYFLVYVLGAERDLNIALLLEELGFVLPQHVDVELRFVSPATKKLCQTSKEHHPNSVLQQTGDNYCCWMDKRPHAEGARIRVSFDADHDFFHDVNHQHHPVPDFVVGLNAGLASDPEWVHTLTKLLASQIPFSFSEPSKHKSRLVQNVHLPDWIRDFNDNYLPPGCPPIKLPKLQLRLNPFHGIVNQSHQTAIVTPHVSNGYFLTWNEPLQLSSNPFYA